MRQFGTIAAIGTTLLALSIAAAADEPGRDARRTPIVKVFEQCRDSVVNISTTRMVRTRSLLDQFFDFGVPRLRNHRIQSVGSGFVVHESGYVVTNAHVVSQASDVRVTFADGRTRPGQIVAVDHEHDLAVLKVDSARPLAYQKLGRSRDIMIGETVVAIGNPLGLQHTVTAGIVSALGRDVPLSRDVVYRGLIQTDAPINPGNSGGPLFNANAELIGINTAIRGDAQNIGFAIPVDRLWELLPGLLDIERRQRVRFGLQVSGTDAEVVAVRKDSPAATAGLRPGDRLVRINGKTLRDGIDYYVRLLGQKPGSDVRLAVRRGSQTLELAVPLQPIPLPDGRKLASQLLGVELEEIPAEARRKYGLPDYVTLVVESVDPNGPADRAGVRPSDLIIRLDRIPVLGLQDVGLVLEQTQARERVLVDWFRLDASALWHRSATLRARSGE